MGSSRRLVDTCSTLDVAGRARRQWRTDACAVILLHVAPPTSVFPPYLIGGAVCSSTAGVELPALRWPRRVCWNDFIISFVAGLVEASSVQGASEQQHYTCSLSRGRRESDLNSQKYQVQRCFAVAERGWA